MTRMTKMTLFCRTPPPRAREEKFSEKRSFRSFRYRKEPK
jgi:hypothetical protein